MDHDRFDRLTRTISHALSRRRLATALGLVATSTLHLAGARKKHKKKKLKTNAYGCVNVGGTCRGKNAACCSGICQGKKPRKGEKDKSTCVAHNALDCPAEADSCTQGGILCGTQNGGCYQTTGQASFCAASGYCVACKKDADCEPEFGPGAACAVCTAFCQATGNTLCLEAAL